uniref:Uncharacterized protein n=1 Tax=Arundo donax TaxID=35708 RepID=A0A0A8Y092_ARUDO
MFYEQLLSSALMYLYLNFLYNSHMVGFEQST